MKKEVINNIFVCDYCKKDIDIRNVYKNDGSFQKDYVSLHDKDICKHCALEVLYKLSSKIKEEDIEEKDNWEYRENISIKGSSKKEYNKKTYKYTEKKYIKEILLFNLFL